MRDVSEVRIENYRETMRKKRERKRNIYYQEEMLKILPLSKKELFLTGLFLYWGEGGKTLRHTLSINNTDPSVLKFALYWMREALDIPQNKIQVYLHFYSDMVIEEELSFWSRELNMPRSLFSKPYIKKSSKNSLDQKGFWHGTCGLRVYNTEIKEKILMAIKVISDNAERNIKEL